jgi:DNA-binding CsgD family transcriptional regulator
MIFRIVNSRYSNYYRKEQQKLIKENNRKLNLMELKKNEEIMRIKNEQLEENIVQKNKELAISTMAMVKKNQFMNALLNDLEPAANDPTVARVLRIIKRSLKNDDDWEFFEQAFDNADKDFLKRLKEKHDALTNHDLKLCAYLRLNLSSKEIAPLLNISVKSVDIKRYRLRKKIDLDHDQNLTEYILSL